MKLIINDPRYRFATLFVSSVLKFLIRAFSLNFPLHKKSLKCPSQTEWEETGIQCLQSTDREGRERGGQNQIQGVQRDISEVLGESWEDDIYHQIQVRARLISQFCFFLYWFVLLCFVNMSSSMWTANSPCHLMHFCNASLILDHLVDQGFGSRLIDTVELLFSIC